MGYLHDALKFLKELLFLGIQLFIVLDALQWLAKFYWIKLLKPIVAIFLSQKKHDRDHRK